MRRLSVRQKKLLLSLNVDDVSDIDNTTWDKLELINDYETLYTDVQRFVYETNLDRIHKKWGM